MGIEDGAGTLEFERGRAACLDNLICRRHLGQMALAVPGCTIEAAACQAVEDVREEGGLLQGRIDDARIVLDEDLLAGLLVLVGDRGVIRLRGEAHGLLVERKAQPVGAELLGGVVVQELLCHRRLDRA